MLFQGQISTCHCLLPILILCNQRCDNWIAPMFNCCSHNTVIILKCPKILTIHNIFRASIQNNNKLFVY